MKHLSKQEKKKTTSKLIIATVSFLLSIHLFSNWEAFKAGLFG